MPITVAAFDWDGTLTRRDCVVPFLTTVAGGPALSRRLAATPLSLISAVMRQDRDRLKQLGVAAAFTGRALGEVAERGEHFAERVQQRWLRPDTLARLRWHQAMGHRVVIVSASLSPYLEPLGSTLGVDAVVCTMLQTDGLRYTGGLDGPNCRGVEKVTRFTAWSRTVGDDVDLAWAYGDSAGDEPLLALATNAVRVTRAPIEAVPTTVRITP
jgi:phosphatidylglycerophosphatase C